MDNIHNMELNCLQKRKKQKISIVGITNDKHRRIKNTKRLIRQSKRQQGNTKGFGLTTYKQKQKALGNYHENQNRIVISTSAQILTTNPDLLNRWKKHFQNPLNLSNYEQSGVDNKDNHAVNRRINCNPPTAQELQ